MTPADFLARFATLADAPNGIPKLRELILQLAVQGKLVPQDPGDGVAGWNTSRLGDVTTVVRGITFPASAKCSESTDGAIACLRTSNVQIQVEWDDLLFVPKDFVKRPDQLVRAGDIVMSMANSRELVGKVALVRHVPLACAFGGFLAVLRPHALLPEWLMIILRSSSARDFLVGAANQTTNIANISAATLRTMPVAIPPRPEQHRIVAKVDELMALCDELEARQQRRRTTRRALTASSLDALANAPDADTLAKAWPRVRDHLDELVTEPESIPTLRQAILQLAVRGQLVPQDPNDQPARGPWGEGSEVVGAWDTPSSWSWVSLGQIADCRLGKMLDLAKNRGSLRPYLRNTNVHWFRFDLGSIKEMRLADDEVAEYQLRKGDVLICEGGHGIGRTAVWSGQVRPMFFQKALHRVRPTGPASGEFLAFCMKVFADLQILPDYFTGAGIPHLTGRSLERISFPLPPLPEQHRIVAKVDELMALCDQLESRLTRARATSEALASSTTHHLVTDPASVGA